MDAGDHYALSDLRQLISEPFAGQRTIPPLQPQHLYELFHLRAQPIGGERIEEVVLSPPPNPNAESPSPLQPAPPAQRQEGADLFSGLREEGDGSFGGASAAGVHSQGRWPRQETLTLLEIRSRLDFKFKEAAEKAPLWEEVSRIMAEEHGYQRSGKKCREKLENLYKYYKKTKEGKAGRHDGKHYRFFRQLEALYGDGGHNPLSDSANLADYAVFHAFNAVDSCLAPSSQEQLQHQKVAENVSLSISSGFESWSSEDDDNATAVGCSDLRNGEAREKEGPKRKRKSWRTKMREFVDQQLERFMAVQEAWLEKMLTTLETREKERISREEERRKREAANLEEEHRFWAKERAWIEARDSALVEALERLSGLEQKPPSPDNEISVDAVEESDCDNQRWPDGEVARLVQIRTAVEERNRGGFPRSSLWEEISAKMASSGYRRSAQRCKEKWEDVSKFVRKTSKGSKKRKESSRACPYYKHVDSLYCAHGSDQRVHENRYDEEAAADQVNEERYVPFLVDGAATTFWTTSFLDNGRRSRE